MPSTFLALAGINEMAISSSSTAYQAARNLEISLVLDISGSMNGNKIKNLRVAATDFVDEVIKNSQGPEYVSFNLIPYGGSVNIGTLFDDYATTLSQSILDPGEVDYGIGSTIEDGQFRFSDGLNCIEYRHEDYNDGLLTANNHPQVPHFHYWSAAYPWCPTSESAVLINTNDTALLKTRIASMTFADGTGSHTGVLWGMKALSPKWRGKLGGDFADRPADYTDNGTLKILIFMTDGNLTHQYRPSVHTDGLEQPVAGERQKRLKRGSYSNSTSNDTAYGRLKTACENLKTNGVRVYTIGFKITAGSDESNQMNDCAVNGGLYYLVQDLDISSAFKSISADVANLRISG